MDIEAAARAMFEAFHARFDRVRAWSRHPDADGTEPGRDAFRAMAAAIPQEPAADPVEPPAPIEAPTEEHFA